MEPAEATFVEDECVRRLRFADERVRRLEEDIYFLQGKKLIILFAS